MVLGYYRVDAGGNPEFLGNSNYAEKAKEWTEQVCEKEINVCHCELLYPGMVLEEGIVDHFWHTSEHLVTVCYK